MEWFKSVFGAVFWFRVNEQQCDTEKQQLFHDPTDLVSNGVTAVKLSVGEDAIKHDVTIVSVTQDGGDKIGIDDVTETSMLVENSPEPSCLSITLYSTVAIAFICVFLVLLRGYVKYVLLSLEETDMWVSFIVFSMLFTVVSFPLTWGYILLNIAAGYLYGLCMGVFVVMTCAVCGLSIAHVIIRKFLAKCIMARINNHSVRAIMRVIDSGHGFRVVVLSRLTPIPFGLQNGLFAVSRFWAIPH